ncbi:MAG: bifunctional riboflavin kinase/FAD synthetase [Bacteroidaceae bacterium]|nr:bifunctional riboflavin kinase/FAD synthetase [Bacteroidaceae bacterium]
MHIVTDILQYDKRPCAATIGSFDGVHRGHIAMLGELRAAATAKGLPLMVVTFAIHPRMLFNEGSAPFLLTPTRKKLELLEAAGVDICVLLDFDHAMAAMSAQQFMNKILVERLGVQMLAVGYDHHFGRPAPGEELEQYIEYGKEMGIEVFGTQPFNVDGTVVSSSVVRRALSEGDVAFAARLLGYNYSLSGSVVHGAGIGRVLGFPTANISATDKMQLLPADGVYEVDVCVDGERRQGVMNIGVKPTISGKERTLEVYIVDFNGDIYGNEITVEFVRRLRGEQSFENINALRFQIEVDVARVKRGI